MWYNVITLPKAVPVPCGSVSCVSTAFPSHLFLTVATFLQHYVATVIAVKQS